MNKKILAALLIIIAAIIVSGCQPVTTTQDNNNDSFNFTDISMSGDNASTPNTSDVDVVVTEPEVDESKASFKIDVIEGGLAKIPITAVDPDGDFLKYTFEKPFNEQGLWQTKIGDEGKYLVKVVVSDGKLSTSDFVLVTVKRANRPPTIECDDNINVQEGDLVIIDCNIFDVDGDVVLVGYDGWMKSSSKKTTFGDVGSHTVVVRAKDQLGESSKEITINVRKTNRPPVIELSGDVVVMETQTAVIKPVIVDYDGDKVKVTYGKPFDENGEWTPEFGDAGIYDVDVTATDGELTTTETVKVIVERKNRVPVFKKIEPISVNEGEKVIIPVNAFDPDGDDVIISYSGWMDSSEKQTTYDDAYPDGCAEKGCVAEYTVKVQASDGVLTETQNVVISVRDVNRPPSFTFE